ncbi:STAS domain-containing protein [Micromonospora sp. 4G57]|uniref:STAS domain-containing protein n=1 Tax=Micromonospora TaxID=1873 RepID=UPI002ACA1F8F|nr:MULTISPECIES: STAS domain-containing protein [unclassified Micromonospora]MDZ5444427.1 STAS domain-containing protein [Micromonospora sp. 4G57]
MATEQTWHWRVDVGADRSVLALSGEIDMSGADRLDDLLHEAIARAGTVEVDLAGLTFIDSTEVPPRDRTPEFHAARAWS